MQPGTCRLAVFTLSTAMLFGAEAMAAQGSGSATLDAVKAHGQMLCGVHGQVPGFSLPDSQGVMRGLDADTCRAILRGAGHQHRTRGQ
jgi:general L-amino acid transport system substrate-binding protein